MKIAIGNDHAGVEIKEKIKEHLTKKGHTVINKGYDGKESVDYPDYIHPVSKEVKEGKADIGVIVCGSGNGAAMTANKHKGIRAAICWSEEIASLAKQHNNANIICFGERLIGPEIARESLIAFLKAKFQGGRHAERIQKISELES